MKVPGMAFVRRFFTSAVLIGLTVYLIFFMPPLYFSLQVAAFIALALYEFFTLLKTTQVPVYRTFGVGMGLLIPLVVYLEFGATQSGEVLFIVFGCLFLFLLQFFRKNNPQALVGISLTLFGILYVSWFLSFLIKIRFLEDGAIWVGYLLAVTKSEDIGAYTMGKLFGRHPLAPHVSPKKSIEGAFGGLVAIILASVALRPFLPLSFSMLHAVMLGLSIGLVGQIGDLSESLMKRFCGAKDSGGLLPGMGGVLDAVDSILFTAPIFYFHLKIYL